MREFCGNFAGIFPVFPIYRLFPAKFPHYQTVKSLGIRAICGNNSRVPGFLYPPPPPASQMSWLSLIPGLFRDEQHRYWLGDHLFAISATGVLSHGKGRQAMERIHATRDEWAPRGTGIHRALELNLLARSGQPGHQAIAAAAVDELAAIRERYAVWVDPLLAHPLWDAVEVCASEMALCSMELNVAGTFDGAWRCNGQLVLFDLKSQKSRNASPYDTRAQLGCYIRMALEHGITFDTACTVWSRPGKVAVQRHGAQECLKSWKAAWGAYERAERPF